MNALVSPKKEWAITRETFDRLLAELHPDRELAGEEYEKIRRKLIKLFEWRGCANAEECVDETFNRVARKISEGSRIQSDDPYSYFHGVALNVLREYWRRAEQSAKSLDEISQGQPLSINPEDLLLREKETEQKERLLEFLNRCLQKIPLENIDLIMRYHHGEESQESQDKARRKELARSLGITPNTLRIRACRIRNTIEECLTKHLDDRTRE